MPGFKKKPSVEPKGLKGVNTYKKVKKVKKLNTSIKPASRSNDQHTNSPQSSYSSALGAAVKVGLKINPKNPTRALFQMARYLLKIEREFVGVEAKDTSMQLKLFSLW